MILKLKMAKQVVSAAVRALNVEGGEPGPRYSHTPTSFLLFTALPRHPNSTTHTSNHVSKDLMGRLFAFPVSETLCLPGVGLVVNHWRRAYPAVTTVAAGESLVQHRSLFFSLSFPPVIPSCRCVHKP